MFPEPQWVTLEDLMFADWSHFPYEFMNMLNVGAFNPAAMDVPNPIGLPLPR